MGVLGIGIAASVLGCTDADDQTPVSQGALSDSAETTTGSAKQEQISTVLTSPPGTNIGQSAKWRSQHDELLAERQAMVDAIPTTYDRASIIYPLDVYVSDPVDINGPGTYSVRFAMAPGTTLPGWGIRQPPDFNANLLFQPASPTATAEGFLEGSLHVSLRTGDPTTLLYPGLTIWLV